MGINRTRIRVSIGIVLAGILFQAAPRYWMRPYAKEGVYYQDWSSESTMQTLAIEDLRDEPLRSLLNIHMQPPRSKRGAVLELPGRADQEIEEEGAAKERRQDPHRKLQRY